MIHYFRTRTAPPPLKPAGRPPRPGTSQGVREPGLQHHHWRRSRRREYFLPFLITSPSAAAAAAIRCTRIEQSNQFSLSDHLFRPLLLLPPPPSLPPPPLPRLLFVCAYEEEAAAALEPLRQHEQLVVPTSGATGPLKTIEGRWLGSESWLGEYV